MQGSASLAQMKLSIRKWCWWRKNSCRTLTCLHSPLSLTPKTVACKQCEREPQLFSPTDKRTRHPLSPEQCPRVRRDPTIVRANVMHRQATPSASYLHVSGVDEARGPSMYCMIDNRWTCLSMALVVRKSFLPRCCVVASLLSC